MSKSSKRGRKGLWAVSSLAGVAAAGGIALYGMHPIEAASQPPKPVPQVVVSKPLNQDIDAKLGFIGQFSAIEHVELRAQVGGTLTEIRFKDGEVVHKGDLLFVIDPRPYEIRHAQAVGQRGIAKARLELAGQELHRAVELKRNDVGTDQNVDQRTSDFHAAQAALEEAEAAVRDADFDLEHCRITAPFTGRIGTHLVSVGNLISGSRAGSGPTTLLATLVSLDPIYLDFDMSEADYIAYTKYRAKSKAGTPDQVELAISGETSYGRHGSLDFLDNVLDRTSGTIHARATVRNTDLILVPGEFARVQLVAQPKVPSLLVPDQAVLPDQSDHLVMTVSGDGTVVPKKVDIAGVRGGLRVIRSGLAADDQVIIDGLPYAHPGAKVAPQSGEIRFASDSQD